MERLLRMGGGMQGFGQVCDYELRFNLIARIKFLILSLPECSGR